MEGKPRQGGRNRPPDGPTAIAVGQNIHRLRVKRGLTLEVLAARAGYAVPTLCNIEKGRRLPSTIQLPRLAVALDCTVSDLFAGAL